MTERNRYEILESLPTYGPMYIPVTDNDEPFYSEGFAIRFFKSDHTDWVANFKPGWTGLNAVYEFTDQQYILVIAGGTCYLMNPDEVKPKSSFGVGYETVIKTLDGRLILQDLTDLTIIEPNGEHWHTERISWDGIKNLKLEGNLVSGLSFDPMNDKDEWVEFVVDLEKRNVKGGSFRQYEFKPMEQNVESANRKNNTKKPWWKIW
ncbi:MAG: hypothetical protein HGB12_13890 [Bacteroidetes bacterium]|nr:hypothetical protein [Bacteroidota bacterium]